MDKRLIVRYDGSMMNSLQTLSYWQDYFGNPSGGLLGLLNAIQNLGNLAGLPFAPFLNDRYGRRWTLFLGCIGELFSSFLRSRLSKADQLKLTLSYDSRYDHSVRFAESRHVPRRTVPYWLWKLLGVHRRPDLAH